MAGYTGLRDMFDGGGAGQSGAKFEGGGILSAAANAIARPAGSRDRGEPDMRTGIGGFARDMVDGGGFGKSGLTFQGGPLSGLLNGMGVRPMGYRDRLGATRPQARPPRPTPVPMPTPRPAPVMAPAPAPAQPNYADRFEPMFERQPVVTPEIHGPYPLTDFGDMLMRLDRDGIPSSELNYADRMALPFQAPPQPQYSGRGSVGMPYPPVAQGDMGNMALVDFLRSRGVI